MTVKTHNIIRDYVVYAISSYTKLKKGGHLKNYFKELRYFKTWYKYRNSAEGTLFYKIPWLVFGSIDFLNDWLTKNMKVFEYGSGGSTLYFSNHVDSVYSVEHDPEWFTITRKAIAENSLQNVNYKLIEPQAYANYNKDNYLIIKECISSRAEFVGRDFKEYVNEIENFKDSFFDLVIVDGRARQSCIAKAIQKIRKGGLLLLDNAEREFYLTPNKEMLDVTKWERKDFVGHFPFAPASILNKTSIFKKLY